MPARTAGIDGRIGERGAGACRPQPECRAPRALPRGPARPVRPAAQFAWVGANGTAIMAALPTMRTELFLSSAGVQWAVNATQAAETTR